MTKYILYTDSIKEIHLKIDQMIAHSKSILNFQLRILQRNMIVDQLKQVNMSIIFSYYLGFFFRELIYLLMFPSALRELY